MDALLVYSTEIEAAQRLGWTLKAFEQTKTRAFAQFELMGLHLGESQARRTLAMRAWLEYWWSDIGKATLRNVRLTHPPIL